MRTLVIGGTGFIGRYILKRLNNPTVVIHRTEIGGAFETMKASFLNLNKSVLKNYPYIINLAKVHSNNPLSRLLLSIRAGLKNREIAINSKKFMYFSGTLVYGNGEADENSKLSPVGFQRIYYFQERFIPEGKAIIVRPSWVLGKGSWFEKFFINYIKKGFVPLYGKGDNFMNIVYVDDVARLSVRIFEKFESGVFNLCSKFHLKQYEFSEILSEITGLPIRRIEWKDFSYGYITWESLTFSLKVRSIHRIVNEFAFEDVKEKLKEILNRL